MEDEKLGNEVSLFGFPIEHKHKLCCLRQELIDSFVDSRYMMFIKYAAFHLQQLSLKKKEQDTNKTTEKEDKESEKEKANKENEKEKDESEENQIEADEAKKIVESITDGNKQECKNCCTKFKQQNMIIFCILQWKKAPKILLKQPR